PLSVAVQFGCGALLVAGLLTRLAGLLVAANFTVAVLMVHFHESFRGWWPAIVLAFLGLRFAAAGSGKFGLDALFGGRRWRTPFPRSVIPNLFQDPFLGRR